MEDGNVSWVVADLRDWSPDAARLSREGRRRLLIKRVEHRQGVEGEAAQQDPEGANQHKG